MKLLASLAGGLAGAVTVTLLHEMIRKVDPSAPRMDLVGKHVTEKLMHKAGKPSPGENQLYATSLAGSIMANTLYYSLAGLGHKNLLSVGSMLGLTAGAGAVALPGKLGLNGIHSSGSTKRKWITMALYLAGGLVAAAVTRGIEKRKNKHIVSPYNPPEQAYKPILDIMV
jgi:hypothetical protein